MISTENIELLLNRSEIEENHNELAGSIEYYQSLSFESLRYSLSRVLEDSKNGIRIENNSLLVPAKNMNVLSQINNLIEAICHIPVTFEYDELNDTYNADFSYLQEEMELLFN